MSALVAEKEKEQVIQINLHKGQTRVWKSEARFTAMIAGTGSGKTVMGPIWLYKQIQNNPTGFYLVVSPTYPMFQKTVLPATKSFLDKATCGEYKAADRVYVLPTGGLIFFGSADNPLSLEGVHCQAAWMDEAGQMKREAWEVIQRRVGFHSGKVLITTTPYNMGWLKTEIYDRWKEGDPDYNVIQFASVENPYYPKEEFERAKATLPDWKFRMFYLGQFAKPEGLIYQDFNASVQVINSIEIPAEWRRIIGLDFGYNNPTAAIWLAVNKDGVVYAYREYYKRGRLPEEIVQDIQTLSAGEKIEAICCDPSEPAIIEMFRRVGLPAQPADNAVMDGIQKVIGLIKTNRFFVFRGLVNTLDEMESYCWKEKGDKIKDEPVKEFDHLMDALRYGVGRLSQEVRRAGPVFSSKTFIRTR